MTAETQISITGISIADPAAGFYQIEVEIADGEIHSFALAAAGNGEAFGFDIHFQNGFRSGKVFEKVIVTAAPVPEMTISAAAQKRASARSTSGPLWSVTHLLH